MTTSVPHPDRARVGVFDSGLGGLSVLRELLSPATGAELIYYADQAHLPWGPRPAEEILRFCQNITSALRQQGCTRVVLACNTASAAALQTLRAHFPELQFVGMEPAIKPAATLTRSGVIGLLATPNTLAGELLTQTRARHAADVRIVSDPCTGLVEAIESGDTAAIGASLQGIVPAMLDAGADVLVLGCTHYVFASAALRALAGPAIRIVDPAAAVAAQLRRLLPAPPAEGKNHLRLVTSGDAAAFARTASQLLNQPLRAEHARWS